MANIDLAVFVVRFNDGSIDHEATLEKFAGEVIKFEQVREQENSTIGAALHALFDQNMGRKLPTPFVVGEVLRALQVQPDSFKALSDKVGDFIRTSPEFVVARGKGGGVGRVRDLEG